MRLLLGGSPCTYWSLVRPHGREITPTGLGWELFLNYVIAKEKFQPDFFLYENNWSASNDIKNCIQEKLKCKLTRINSNLVSAQNRDRFYVYNWTNPALKDRQIFLRDIITPTNGINTKIAYGIGYRNRRDQNGKLTRRYEGGKYEKANCLTTAATDSMIAIPVSNFDLKETYIVKNKKLYMNSDTYTSQLKDGIYHMRKLNNIEYARLQTLPDDYTQYGLANENIKKKKFQHPITQKEYFKISATKQCKLLGNGWTAQLIIEILKHALKDISRNEKIIVLSMYDGIGTGYYCLKQLGFNNIEYHAYEIDEIAIAIALFNHPDIIYHGDAFNIRKDLF